MHRVDLRKYLFVAFFEHRRPAITLSVSGTQKGHSKEGCRLCVLGVGRSEGQKMHLA